MCRFYSLSRYTVQGSWNGTVLGLMDNVAEIEMAFPPFLLSRKES